MEDNLVTQSWNRGHPQPTTCACLAATISSKKITSKTSNAKLFAQCIPPVSCSRKVSSRLPHTPLTTIQVKYQGHGYPGQRHGRLIPSPIVRQDVMRMRNGPNSAVEWVSARSVDTHPPSYFRGGIVYVLVELISTSTVYKLCMKDPMMVLVFSTSAVQS